MRNDDETEMKKSSPVSSDEARAALIDEEPTSTMTNDHHFKLFGRVFNSVIVATHVNICLYATCFWIQIGVLPVSTL